MFHPSRRLATLAGPLGLGATLPAGTAGAKYLAERGVAAVGADSRGL